MNKSKNLIMFFSPFSRLCVRVVCSLLMVI
nr:MAG TPA: hypothetical protein [Caudoviricetes sp.]